MVVLVLGYALYLGTANFGLPICALHSSALSLTVLKLIGSWFHERFMLILIYSKSKEKFCISKVLIFCVEFWEMSHLTHDLSHAEKKITVVTS